MTRVLRDLGPYLEGRGDVVLRLITPIAYNPYSNPPFVNLLTKSP